MRFFQRTGFRDSTLFLGGDALDKYVMGLGQRSRRAPSSWVQMSSVIVNMLRGLDHRTKIVDPMTRATIHTVGLMFVDDTDSYCWVNSLKTREELFDQIQKETNAWGNLLIATGGCLRPEKCFWYLLDYECMEGVWEPADTTGLELLIPSDIGPPAPIISLDVNKSRKTLGVRDCPVGGNTAHLK